MVEESAVRFTIDVDGETQLDQALSRFGNHLSDMTRFFELAADMLSGFVQQQFDTEGGRAGAWAPLSPFYAAYKLARVGSAPILVYSGRLRMSLIERTGDSIREITPDAMKWGTSVPYATFHQRGGRFLPQRRMIDLTEDDRRALMKALQRFLVGDPEEFGW